ncbi:WD40 repeat-like protein [Venustampulla echinocandica]|uniref:Anaphase-promoting complex subunit 4 n=1 Tax=Venustampulla echinocandica TaxID=2656787 RepID=A0A370TZ14_9HELO|nr:WD40 repeat-like protein [Venustampulla echinocandica]RDL40755.1 WD40 repeat-like protein [Venustampulla echinocandica]
MDEPSALEALSEKTLAHAADSRLITYCPSMDLVALGTADQQVLVYRLNGQRVYGTTQKPGASRVENIKWKPNGQLLAIAWSDGIVRLVGAENSRIVHQFSAGEGVTGITCVGWGSNLTSRSSSAMKSATSWERLLSSEAILSENKAYLDLPRDLSQIDIERSLPKLSVLPAGGSSDEVFCSWSSLDAIFRPFDPKDNNAIDVMVVGTKEGHVHVTIYNSFVVGAFPSPILADGVPSHLALHASHEKCSTHALLMKSSGSESLYFVPMDLRFISVSSEYLSLLASRSTALQNLLRYIHQVQMLMVTEWKSTQELPGRFLGNINETLAEKDTRNIVQALYHSVATGHTFPAVKEWLVDELQERGHKRWEKAVVSGLENLRRLVHENMLPALERCTVILSRFSGIAKFQSPNETVGFSSHQISLIIDTLACLHLLSSKILVQVVDELDLFSAFSLWLRNEIDRLASDSSDSPKEDDLEKEASIDHSKVLLYLQTCMTTSPLEVYFGGSTPDDYSSSWNQAEQGLPMFDILDKQLQKQEAGLPFMRALPRVELVCKHLTGQAKAIFDQIAEAEKRNVLFGKAQLVGIAQDDQLMDMRLCSTTNLASHTYIAFTPKGLPSSIQITRHKLAIENGISTVQQIDSSVIQLGDGQIRDIMFLGDNGLLALWESHDAIDLLSIAYNTPNTVDTSSIRNYPMEYLEHLHPTDHRPTLFNNGDVRRKFSQHKFPKDGSFIPETLEIREESKGHGGTAERVVILGKDKLHYKVFCLSGRTQMGIKRDDGTGDDEDISMS